MPCVTQEASRGRDFKFPKPSRWPRGWSLVGGCLCAYARTCRKRRCVSPGRELRRRQTASLRGPRRRHHHARQRTCPEPGRRRPMTTPSVTAAGRATTTHARAATSRPPSESRARAAPPADAAAAAADCCPALMDSDCRSLSPPLYRHPSPTIYTMHLRYWYGMTWYDMIYV